MDQEELRDWKRAGEIAAKARDAGARAIGEGVLLSEVASFVEVTITDLRGGIAFPVNLALNEDAAHYTPRPGDRQRFQYGDLVKLDVGAHVNGCIGDTAVTVEVGSSTYTPLIEASRRALDSVIEVIRGNISLSTLGGIVEGTMHQMGFNPIVNLTGHSIERYRLHAGLSVPNYNDRSENVIHPGTLVAVEPFSTTGVGEVRNHKRSNIFRLVRRRSGLTSEQSKAIDAIEAGPGHLPFSERWLSSRVDRAEKVLNGLVRSGVVYSYPILRETSQGMVAQSEHTIHVTEDGGQVLTY